MFLGNLPISLAHQTCTQIETLEAPPKYAFLCENIMLPFAPIIGEKLKTLGKLYGIKLRVGNMW